MKDKYKTDGGTDGLPLWPITEPEIPERIKQGIKQMANLKGEIADIILEHYQNETIGQSCFNSADEILALPEIAAALKLLERAKKVIPNGEYCCFISKMNPKLRSSDWCENHSCSGDECFLWQKQLIWDETLKRHKKCPECPIYQEKGEAGE